MSSESKKESEDKGEDLDLQPDEKMSKKDNRNIKVNLRSKLDVLKGVNERMKRKEEEYIPGVMNSVTKLAEEESSQTEKESIRMITDCERVEDSKKPEVEDRGEDEKRSQSSSLDGNEYYVLKPQEVITYINLHGGPFVGMNLAKPVRINLNDREGLPTLSLAYTRYGANKREYDRMRSYDYGNRKRLEIPSRDSIVEILHRLNAPWEACKLVPLFGNIYPNVPKGKWRDEVEKAIQYYMRFSQNFKRKIEDSAVESRISASDDICQVVLQQIAASSMY